MRDLSRKLETFSIDQFVDDLRALGMGAYRMTTNLTTGETVHAGRPVPDRRVPPVPGVPDTSAPGGDLGFPGRDL